MRGGFWGGVGTRLSESLGDFVLVVALGTAPTCSPRAFSLRSPCKWDEMDGSYVPGVTMMVWYLGFVWSRLGIEQT